jgi:arginase
MLGRKLRGDFGKIGLLLVAATSGCKEREAVATDRYRDDGGRTRVALIKMPYHGERNVPEISGGPDYLAAGGLEDRLVRQGALVRATQTVDLTPEEGEQYGGWHRMGLANAHLASLVTANEREGVLSVALLANCTSLLGVLAGLQHAAASGQSRRVGLVFIDAHGDFNTPETTLSGMLGGMPVAVAAGLGLKNLRTKSTLDPPIPPRRIVLVAARDLDPLEKELLDQHQVARLSVEDVRTRSERLHAEMRRLSEETDVIYVHIDMDVLDPKEVPGHPLTVPDGPTSAELGAALTEMFRYDKVAALGIASTPFGERDPDQVSREAAYTLALGALQGVGLRGNR